jgi:phospholipid N-methyltransferase
MSATNRGAIREPLDAYPTPDWLIEAMIEHLRRYRPQSILEPAAGDGAIVRALRQAFPDAEIVIGDINQGQDFLKHEYSGQFDLIMMNPPYRLALAFIKRALELRTPLGAVVMLLRLDFLGAQWRAAWWRTHKPSGIYITPRRPRFVGNGNDATEYAWFEWSPYPSHGLKLEFLPTERKRKNDKEQRRTNRKRPSN